MAYFRPVRSTIRSSSIIEGAKASLERLGLDYVDVIFAHRPDPTGMHVFSRLSELYRSYEFSSDGGDCSCLQLGH